MLQFPLAIGCSAQNLSQGAEDDPVVKPQGLALKTRSCRFRRQNSTSAEAKLRPRERRGIMLAWTDPKPSTPRATRLGLKPEG